MLETPTPGSTGADGDVQINSGQTINLSIDSLPASHTCADGGSGVAYSLVELTSWYARANYSLGYDCLLPGDEVLLINLQGYSGSLVNVGNYEFLHVSDVIGDKIYFTTPKTKFYGEHDYDDTNIGRGSSNQLVVLQRVPNYNNMVINGTLTAKSWDDYKYGILAFRVAGTLSGAE